MDIACQKSAMSEGIISKSSGSLYAMDSNPLDPREERRLIWKCDLRVLPIISVLYVFAFLDRINIGNAWSAFLCE